MHKITLLPVTEYAELILLGALILRHINETDLGCNAETLQSAEAVASKL